MTPAEPSPVAWRGGYRDSMVEWALTGKPDTMEVWLRARMVVEPLFTGAGLAALIEEAVKAALDAQLPAHYRWGDDAMEQFDFGKQRASEAVREVLLKAGRVK